MPEQSDSSWETSLSDTASITEHEPFTEERFRQLWDSGMSASKIGAIFGKTKNAIIGRRKRLGLAPRASGGSPKSKKWRTELEQTTQSIKPVKPASGKYRAVPAPQIRFTSRAEVTEPDTGEGISFEEMASNSHACKFPVTNKSPFKFCGAQKKLGSPYCKYHARLSRRWTRPVPASMGADAVEADKPKTE